MRSSDGARPRSACARRTRPRSCAGRWRCPTSSSNATASSWNATGRLRRSAGSCEIRQRSGPPSTGSAWSIPGTSAGRSAAGSCTWALGVAAAREPEEGPFEVRTNVPAADAAAHGCSRRAGSHTSARCGRCTATSRRRTAGAPPDGVTIRRFADRAATSARSGRCPRRRSRGTTGTSRARSSPGRASGIGA